MNHLLAMFGYLPAIWRLVFVIAVEGFDVEISDGRADVGESPGDSLVVSDDDEWDSGKSYSSDVEAGRFELRFIPDVRDLVFEVHIVGE